MSKEKEGQEVLEMYFQLTEAQRKQFLRGIQLTVKSNKQAQCHLRLAFSSSASPLGPALDTNRRLRDAQN